MSRTIREQIEELEAQTEFLESCTCIRCDGYGCVRTNDDRFEDVCPECNGSGKEGE